MSSIDAEPPEITEAFSNWQDALVNGSGLKSDISSPNKEPPEIEEFFSDWQKSLIDSSERYKPDMVSIDELERAETDPLMEIPVRRRLFERLNSLKENHVRNFGIIMVDVNNLKPINDRCGHDTGDGYLRIFSLLLKRDTDRKNTMLYRYGGDEVAIIVENITSQEDLDKIGKRLETALRGGGAIRSRTENELPVDSVVPTAALGGIWIGPQATDTDVEKALDSADAAMYDAKLNYSHKSNTLSLAIPGGQIDQFPSKYIAFDAAKHLPLLEKLDTLRTEKK